MRIKLDKVIFTEKVNYCYDGLMNPAEYEAAREKWEAHRQTLIKSKDVIKYSKEGKVKVMTIELEPDHFVWADGLMHHHLELDRTTEQLKVKSYTRRQWVDGYIPTKITSSGFYPSYHPGFQYLCNVLFNAKENAIELSGHNPRAKYIDKIVSRKTSETNMMFYFRVASCCITDSEFIHKNNTEFTISTNEVGYPTIKKNNQVTDNMGDLIELMGLLEGQFYYKKGYSMHRDYVPIYRILEPIINDWIVGKPMDKSYHITITERLEQQWQDFRRGPSYKDLPFSQIEIVGLYNQYKYFWNGAPEMGVEMREKVLNAIAYKGSREAVDECFYGYVFPNSIRKLLIKAGLLRFSIYTYKLISRAVSLYGVDKTRNFITNPSKGGELDIELLTSSRVLLAAFSIGWEVGEHRRLQVLLNKDRETKKRLKDKDVLLRDTVDMYDYLLSKAPGIELQSRNIKEIHDQLAPIYTAYKSTEHGSEMEALKTVSTADQLKPFAVDDFTLRSPFTAYELMTVGREMRHCVAAYATKFYYRNLDIALLVRDNEYLVCLEIRGNHVVQAKMRFNVPVRENQEYVKLVKQFMAINGLNIATSDIDGGMENGWARYQQLITPNDSVRVEAIKSLQKARREKYLATA